MNASQIYLINTIFVDSITFDIELKATPLLHPSHANKQPHTN